MKTILSLLVVTGLCWAGEPDTIWTKRFGGTSWDFAQGGCADFSGGFVLCGSYQHPTGPQGTDMYAVRVDALTGDAIYSRTYGGTASDQAADVHYGSFRTLVVGTTSSYGANTPNVYVVATNAVGDTNWTRAFDTGGVEGALAVDRFGTHDYFIAGYKSFLGNFDGLVMKMDSTGTLLWSRVLGGSAHDQLFEVLALPDGGCVAVGETFNFGINAPPRGNAWMIRYDASGDTVWTRAIGDSAHDQRANAIVQTSDGGFLLVGYEDHPLGNQDFLLIKTDASGNGEWVRVFGGANDDVLLDVVVSCETFTVSGYTESQGAGARDGFLAEVDLNGDTLWTKTMGGADDDMLYALSSGCNPFYDAGFYATGLTKNIASGPQDAWLMKLGADPQMWLTAPVWCDHYVIGSTITAIWGHQGLEAFPYLSLELNRDYPSGAWEMINPNFYNASFLNFSATGPVSHNCRLRLTKLSGAAAQAISEPFSIIPTGTLTYPLMDWDSSFFQDIIREIAYVERDGGFAYGLGRAIHKRDSVGDEVWSFLLPDPQNTYNYSAGDICELSNGDIVSAMTVDSAGEIDPSWVVALRCDSMGNAISANVGGRPIGLSAGATDVAADDSGGFWILAATESEGGGSLHIPAVLHYPQDSVLQLLDMYSCIAVCCATSDDGLLIAGSVGDPFALEQDVLLISVDANYDTLWTRSFDLGENEIPVELIRLGNGNHLLLGQMSPWVGGTNRAFYAEVNSLGDTVQTWTYSDRDNTQMYGLAQDSDGRIVSSGTTNFTGAQRDFLVTKFDCDGQVDWEIQYGGGNSESFYDLAVARDGGYLAAGSRFFPSGPGLGDDRGTAVRFGPETFYTPPACPPADSLVIKKDVFTNSVTLTWTGSEQGAYFIYTSPEPGDFPGGGWSQIACVEAGPPPSRATLTWTDYNLTPEKKFYVVVHECNQSCGGGEN